MRLDVDQSVGSCCKISQNLAAHNISWNFWEFRDVWGEVNPHTSERERSLLDFYLSSHLARCCYHNLSGIVPTEKSYTAYFIGVRNSFRALQLTQKKKATLTFTFSTCHDIDRSPQQRARGLKETFKRVHPSATRDFNFLFFLWKIWFCLISCSFFLHSYESFIISREEIRWSIEPCARRSSTFLIWFGYQKKLDQTEF